MQLSDALHIYNVGTKCWQQEGRGGRSTIFSSATATCGNPLLLLRKAELMRCAKCVDSSNEPAQSLIDIKFMLRANLIGKLIFDPDHVFKILTNRGH